MAGADKLWFELGVRDEVSKVLDELMRKSDKLASVMENNIRAVFDSIGKEVDEALIEKATKNFYKNILDIANVFDKIHVTQKRISEAMGETGSKEAKKSFSVMSKELEKLEKKYNDLTIDPNSLTEAGKVQALKTKDAIDLLIKDSMRYIDTVEAQDRAEARNAANESRRADDLKAKYYELQRYRKQMSEAIVGAVPGANLTNATSLINTLSAKMGAVTRAQRNGTGMPASATGADYDEFLRRVKAEINSLTGATNDYNSKLEQNKQIQAQLNRLKADAVSQQTIAGIRRQTNEYSALSRKIQEIETLTNRVNNERVDLQAGRISTLTYTRDRITEELNAIQRRYNEALAAGRQRELDDAAAKNQKTAATRKAMEAVSALAHVNQGLISSYNRVAEAGSNANRITLQLQQQIGAYAGLYGLERILKSVITIGGQYEVQHAALQNILGDIQEANILFGQLQGLAIESPKTFMELTAYAKQLSAYQIPANELYDTTKRLADMSSGLGVDMNRLILAYGQVRSAAVLRGQELRQFTEAGIPMVQALADKFTQMNGKLTTTADVFKLISQRAVSFEMVKEVLWDMTSQGGQFFNMQAELADTLFGKWQKLQDQWQIMLGNLAGGPVGDGIKSLLELAVTLASAADKLAPALALFGVARLAKKSTGGIVDVIDKRTGDMAVRNMLLAKEKEANRLERERIQYGRVLNAHEQALVSNKNRLVSSDYQILALENQISAKKAHQLMLDGQMSKQHFYRYLQMQGYTREQRKQISLGNLQALRQGPNPQPLGTMGKLFGVGAGGILGFMGGWIGIITTVAGAIGAAYSFISQKNEELSQKGDAMMSHAQQGANSLLGTLNNLGSGGDSTSKKIEALEEALMGAGEEGRRIVAESRGIDDISKRFETLNERAVAYQKTLERLGTPQGKALHESALDKSDIEDEVKDYEDTRNEEYKLTAQLEKFSAKYRQMIDTMRSRHKELNDELTSSNLFENLRTLLSGKYAAEAITYYSGPARSALTDYYNAVKKTNDAFEGIHKDVIPKLMSDLRTEAAHAGVDLTKPFEKLSETEKETLRAIAANFAGSLENASEDTRNSIANWIGQGFYAKLFLSPVLNLNELTGLPLALDQWQKANGLNLWNKNDLKEADSDFISFSKKNSQRKVDLEKRVKDLKKQLEGPLSSDIIESVNDQIDAANTELSGLNQSLKEGKWVFDKSLTKGSKGSSGSKKDTVLEGWRNRLRELQEFWREYEALRKRMGNEEAIQTIRESGVFPSMFNDKGELLTNVRGGLVKALRDFMKTTDASTGDRKKFQNEILKSIFNVSNKDAEEAAGKMLKRVQDALSRQSRQFDLYKQILSQTGSKELAMNAFADGKMWNDQARSMADNLRQMMEENAYSEVPVRIDWDADEETAKQYFRDNFKNGDSLYELWQTIVKLIRDNYVNGLKDSANATASLLSEAEKIKKVEEEIAELRRQGVADNDPRMLAKQKELDKAQADAFEKSTDYLRFYEAILSMTIPEAEAIGQKIRQNLNKELQNGAKTANQYLKEIKNIDAQMKKLRDHKNGLSAFMSGGINGYLQNRYDAESDKFSNAVIQYENAIKQLREAQKNGDEAGIKQAEAAKSSAESLMKGAGAAMGGAQAAMGIVGIIDQIIHGIDGVVQGIKGTFDEIKEMYDALGHDTDSGSWQDWGTFLNAFSSASASATKGWDSLKSGDIGGAIQGTVGSVTSWFTAIAKGWDSKMDKQIQVAQAQLNATNRLRDSIENTLSRTLGNVYEYKTTNEQLEKLRESMARTEEVDEKNYKERAGNALAGAGTGALTGAAIGSIAGPIGTVVGAVLGGIVGGIFGGGTKTYTVNYYGDDTIAKMKEALESQSYFDEQYALLYKQRDELIHQLQGEEDKKNSDDEKIEDYKAQIEEVKDQIAHFAEDMAKALWDIDVKDWATQLGDALFEAWQKGENGAEAFKKKSAEIMADLSKNLATKKLVEVAMKPVLDAITSEMERTDGLLDATSMERISNALSVVGGTLPDSFNSLLDSIETGLGRSGLGSMKDDSTSSSASSTIKGITETTADLLASYVNAIRADVSVDRSMIAMYYPQFLNAMSQNNTIANAQLEQLRSVVQNTSRNADAAVMIYELLHRIAPDGTRFNIK